jgi:hypothetical protein
VWQVQQETAEKEGLQTSMIHSDQKIQNVQESEVVTWISAQLDPDGPVTLAPTSAYRAWKQN